MTATLGFQESNLETLPIRQLGLTITGTFLEPLLAEFERELEAAGLRRLKPRFYLSNEWGVPFGTVSIAIPFYLAHPELTSLHAQRSGFVEGVTRWDILRYLRHEMGHVVNYGYRLYEHEEWLQLFGRMDEPYQEEYRPEPFSRRFVQHLPGWYAQKHPDEDWAETFAVWLTPERDWRTEYADWPVALSKLDYCAKTICRLGDADPAVTTTELDEDVTKMEISLEQFYAAQDAEPQEFRHHLDAALRTIFEDYGRPEDRSSTAERLPASSIVREAERQSWPKCIAGPGTSPSARKSCCGRCGGGPTRSSRSIPQTAASKSLSLLPRLPRR